MKKTLGAVAALTVLSSLSLTLTAFGSTQENSTQSDQGKISVTDQGAPAVSVDVFVIDPRGKQFLGTTDNAGQLAFDPALLPGKIRVTVAARKCRDGVEVYLVSVATDDACKEVEKASGATGCKCTVVGPIWSGPFISVDVTSSLTGKDAGHSILRNPWLWAGTGAVVGTAVIVGSGGGNNGTSAPSSPPLASPSPITPSTQTSSVAGLAGTYDIRVLEVDDPGNQFPRIGNLPGFIEIFINNGTFRVTAEQPWVRVDGRILNSGDFDASGLGGVAGRAGVLVRFTGRIDSSSSPYRITGWYEMGVAGELPGAQPIRYRIDGNKR